MVFPAFAPAIAAIGSVFSGLGPSMAALGSSILPSLSVYISRGLEVIQTITGVAELIAKSLGLLRPDEDIASMGMRAILGAEQGITLDRYDRHEDYVQALREINIDANKQINPLHSQLAGLVVVTASLGERLNTPDSVIGMFWHLVGQSPLFFTPERLLRIFESDLPLSDIEAYFSDRLSGAEFLEVEDALIGLERNANPNLSEDEARMQINAAREGEESR